MRATISARHFFSAFIIAATAIAVFNLSTFAQNNNAPRTIQTQQTDPSQANQQNDILERVQQSRQQAQQSTSAARENFNESLSGIENQAARTAVERIDSALTTVNTNKTTAWARALDSLSSILERIQNQVDEAQENGDDTTAASQLAEEATDAINTASTAIEEQAGNQYTMEITDEQTLRQSIQPTVTQFKEDLRSTLENVVSAKESVKQAARGLSSINTNNEETAAPDSNLQ